MNNVTKKIFEKNFDFEASIMLLLASISLFSMQYYVVKTETLCTCTVLIWVRDDFEEWRAMRLQRRRGMIQQRDGARGEHRSTFRTEVLLQ